MIIARNTDVAAQRARVRRMRQQLQLERVLEDALVPILSRQVIGAAGAINAGERAGITEAVRGQAGNMKATFETQFIRVAGAFAPAVIDAVAGKKAASREDTIAERIATAEARGAAAEVAFWRSYGPWLRKVAAAHVKEITDETLFALRTELERGVADGLSNREISRSILQRAGLKPLEREGRSAIHVWKRAATIARTETHAGASEAVQAAVKSTGVPMRRRWVSAADARTRPTHRAANGQERGMEEPFIVGGEKLMYPGDPAGSAAESINCRCACVYTRAKGRR